MKYYKLNNEVYAYELDGSQDHLIGDKVAMTAEEIELHINPPKTAEQLDAEARQAKQLALDSTTVTTASGKVFDGRDKDQARMLSAIQASDTLVTLYTTQFNTIVEPTLEEVEAFNSSITKATTTMWKLNDNTTVEITLDELKEAQALSIQALGNIIVGV